jgi:peptidoglycan/LPS O-acetylase OafA/YrhL
LTLAIEPSPELATTFQRSYRRRRNVMRGLLAVVVIVWLGLVSAMLFGAPTGEAGFSIWMGLAVVVGICSLGVWRCPRCGASLGRSLRLDRCPHCFVPLEAESRQARD